MARRWSVSSTNSGRAPAALGKRPADGDTVDLRGIAWDHPRGIAPLRATAAAFAELHPDVRIVWEGRSLEQFAYAPLAELAVTYDLLVIDHPHVGASGMGDLIVPMDEYIAEAFLADQATNTTGPSHASYQWAGQQWALAIDAAAQVAAYRVDLLERAGVAVPRTWEEVLNLADRQRLGIRVAIPLNEIDAACSLMSIGVNLVGPSFWTIGAGYDAEALLEATAILLRLARHIDSRSFGVSPTELLHIMGTEDSVAYVPLVFGYSNYSRPGFLPKVVSFTDVPGVDGAPSGSVLGGAGLAVSRSSRSIRVASDYAAFVASPAVQRDLYFASGGQPGHRTAWVDPHVNQASHQFFAATLTTMERAFLRPRLAEEPGFLRHQARVGETLREALQRDHDVRKVAAAVEAAAAVLA